MVNLLVQAYGIVSYPWIMAERGRDCGDFGHSYALDQKKGQHKAGPV